jgi:hypothetical protein
VHDVEEDVDAQNKRQSNDENKRQSNDDNKRQSNDDNPFSFKKFLNTGPDAVAARPKVSPFGVSEVKWGEMRVQRKLPSALYRWRSFNRDFWADVSLFPPL